MATDRLTLIAELKDRLTGPAKKAARAVDDLGQATEKSAQRSAKADKTAAAAAQDRARKVEAAERRVQSSKRATDQKLSASNIATQRASRNHLQALKAQDAGITRSQKIMDAMGGVTTDTMGRVTRQSQTFSERVRKSMNSGLDAAPAANRFRTGLEQAVGHARTAASRIDEALSGAGDRALLGAGAVAAFSLAGGAKRIADAQQADVVMETMLISPSDRADLMGQFKGLAQDTPFSTGSIAAMGSGLIASGMDQSQVEKSMQGAIDTAATFGMSLEEMALPLKQIQAKGKLQGDDLLQLMDRNIPMMDWIAKQKGVDKSQVQDLVSKGQVSSEDVFAAMAANSAGGAERAAGTLKGSWTNFMSSLSQGGEAYLEPLVDPLTELLGVAKDSVQDLQPVLKLLGEGTAIIVKGLTPALPVLIPLLAAAAGGFAAWKTAKVASLAVTLLTKGVRGFTGVLGGGNGAAAVMGMFGKETRFAQSDVQTLAGQGGLGRMNERLRDSTKTMSRAERAAFGLGKAIGGISIAAVGLNAVGSALNGIQPGEALDSSKAANLMAGSNALGLDSEIAGAEWANGNSGKFNSALFGTMDNVNNVGDLINRTADPRMGESLYHGVNKLFGNNEDYLSKGKNSLSGIDDSLASMVQSGDKARAGAMFNQFVTQSGSEENAMKMFPNYKSAVLDSFTEQGRTADDDTLMQAMRSGQGYRSGGYTGDGSASAPAGLVHKKEFVFNATRTAQIGVDNLRAMHAGRAPVGGGDTISPNITIYGASAADEAVIRRAVDDGITRALTMRKRKSLNTHGTRSVRGAH